jgi:hypothetical protein
MSLLNVPYQDTRSPLRLLRRHAPDLAAEMRARLAAGDILWGVARRDGCTDLDDPRAHAGLVQHAFPLGSDDRAVCGYRPPRRRSEFAAEMRVELAAPSAEYNPPCPSCVEIAGAPPDVGALHLEAGDDRVGDTAPTP